MEAYCGRGDDDVVRMPAEPKVGIGQGCLGEYEQSSGSGAEGGVDELSCGGCDGVEEG